MLGAIFTPFPIFKVRRLPMIFGTGLLLNLHVLITFAGMISGLVVLFALMGGSLPRGWNAIFLLFTILTSVTGFAFFANNHPVTPAQILGAISLIDLGIALYALYVQRMEGRWRAIYVVTAILALYFNVFVLVVQLFQKLPPLSGQPPVTGGPVFGGIQGVVLLAFVFAGWRAVKRFRSVFS
jgi:polyferredoxin